MPPQVSVESRRTARERRRVDAAASGVDHRPGSCSPVLRAVRRVDGITDPRRLSPRRSRRRIGRRRGCARERRGPHGRTSRCCAAATCGRRPRRRRRRPRSAFTRRAARRRAARRSPTRVCRQGSAGPRSSILRSYPCAPFWNAAPWIRRAATRKSRHPAPHASRGDLLSRHDNIAFRDRHDRPAARVGAHLPAAARRTSREPAVGARRGPRPLARHPRIRHHGDSAAGTRSSRRARHRPARRTRPGQDAAAAQPRRDCSTSGLRSSPDPSWASIRSIRSRRHRSGARPSSATTCRSRGAIAPSATSRSSPPPTRRWPT